MPEGKQNNGWAIYTVRKLIEYLTIASSLWIFGVPWFNQTIEDRIKVYEEENKKTPLRTLLAEETGIPSDRLHIVIGKWYKDQAEHDALIGSVWPILEEELNSISPRLVIKDNREFWVADDGEYYRVHRAPDGRGSYYSNGRWHFIYW
jgi:hypothetical protein